MNKIKHILAISGVTVGIMVGAGVPVVVHAVATPHAVTADEPTPTPTHTFVSQPAPMTDTTITLSEYGDSISAWNGTGPIVGNTWTMDLQDPNGAVYVNEANGYAHGGYTLAQVLPLVVPTTSNYAFIMLGTNDVGPKTLDPTQRWGTSMFDMTNSLQALITATGLPSSRVIVSAIAPDDAQGAAVTAWNLQEQNLCLQTGCHFIDPWGAFRDANNHYLPGLSPDGIHPYAAGSQILADTITASVLTLP